MAASSCPHVRRDLLRALERHDNEASRINLMRSALMWLCATQHHLRPRELWLLLQIEQTMDTYDVERLLRGGFDSARRADEEERRAQEEQATEVLRGVLGDLMEVRDDGYVLLAEQDEVQRLLTTLANENNAERETDALTGLAFTMSQAHIVSASVCMLICTVSTPQLSQVHIPCPTSTVVVYGWSCWSTHFALSGYQLGSSVSSDDDDLGVSGTPNLFCSMATRICRDLLSLLLSLADFVTAPIVLPAGECSFESSVLVKGAQEALLLPLGVMTFLTRQNAMGEVLRDARSRFEAVEASMPGTVNSSEVTPTVIDELQVNHLLAAHGSHLTDHQKSLMRALSTLARVLRHLCGAFAEAPLYDALIKSSEAGDDTVKEGHSWSPTDVLVYVAAWAETVAGYPFWGKLPPITWALSPAAAFSTRHVKSPDYVPAMLIASRVTTLGPAMKPRCPVGLRRSVQHRPQSVSLLRWKVAQLRGGFAKVRRAAVHKIGVKLTGTSTVNDIATISNLSIHDTSSLASLPPQMYGTTDPLSSIPQRFASAIRRRLSDLITGLIPSTSLTIASTPSPFAYLLTPTTLSLSHIPALYPQAKAKIFSSTDAAVVLTVGILLHHVQRMLVPWLAGYQLYCTHPIEALRDARSNADVFLDFTLAEVSWRNVAFMFAQKYIWDILGCWAVAFLATAADTVPYSVGDAQRFNRTHQHHSRERNLAYSRYVFIAKVFLVMWTLSAVEYLVVRTSTTLALSWAIYNLTIAGGTAEHAALRTVVARHWSAVLFTLHQLTTYVACGIVPMIWRSLNHLRAGRPTLLVAWVGGYITLMKVLRYRSRLFLALEVSPLCIIVVYAFVAVVMLVVEVVRDPLGLAASGLAVRRAARETEGVLQEVKMGQMEEASRSAREMKEKGDLSLEREWLKELR